MVMLDSTLSALRRPYSEFEVDEAQLAVAGFLARYGGRTLEAYRHDLRGFWASPRSVEDSTMRGSHGREAQEVRPGVP